MADTKEAKTQTSILSEQIFAPKNRFSEGRLLSSSDGIIRSLPIYYWPAGITDDEKLAFLGYMTAFGLSDDESPSRWATWMYTYIVLCFEGMQRMIKSENGREYVFRPLPVQMIKKVVEARDSALSFDGSGDNQDYSDLVRQMTFPTTFPSMPLTVDMFPEDLAGGGTTEAVYGYCALLIFMAGKKINEKNQTTITERRPQNLIDTYGIPPTAQYFLIGEGKMKTRAHNMCNQAWITYAPARKAIITDVAAFANGNTLPQRIVYTVSKLLEYVGMQPAYYIHRFLQAFPESKNYACIRPALGVYAASIREVAKADSRIQPYYKVIHGDLTKAFHRNGLLNLAACAISFEKHTSPSMRNFTLGEGATMAVNMFDAEASSRNERTLSEYNNVADDSLNVE